MPLNASVHYLACCKIGTDPLPWFLTAASMSPHPGYGFSRTTIDAKNYAALDEIDAHERAGYDACAEREGLGAIDWTSLSITQVSYRASREVFTWDALAHEVDDGFLDEDVLEKALKAMVARAGAARRDIAVAAGTLLARMAEFHAGEIETGPIPITLWGKDHWSVLAYVETVMVEHQGRFEIGWDPRLRQRSDRFSTFWRDQPTPLRPKADSSKDSGPVRGKPMDEAHTTRLNDGRSVPQHDDWSCLEDMVAAGVVIGENPNLPPGVEPGQILVLTPLGHDLCAGLRRHKASPGGRFATFRVA